MRRYLLLIYHNELEQAQLTPEELDTEYGGYVAFEENIRQKDILLSSGALLPSRTVTTIQVREGRVHTTDGPLLQTKEQLCGFYLLNVQHFDEAITWAAKAASLTGRVIEIRPAIEFT
jgi:hypothetical protein